MNTKQIIEQMEKEFDREFVRDNGANIEDSFIDPNGSVGPVKKFIRDYTRTLLESFGEEIVGEKVQGAKGDAKRFNYDPEWYRGYNACVAEQRLKVKEIINSISK